MANRVAGSVYKAFCPQLRRMHRNGSEKWFEIQRCLVVVQQSRFQELTSLRQKQAKAASVGGLFISSQICDVASRAKS
jgi:hypothetical protein